MTDVASYKHALTQHFDARVTYGRGTPQSPLVDRVLQLFPPRPNERVLDIATGTAFIAIRVAELVGLSGEVIGVDLSSGMLERAREAASGMAGRANLRFLCADAENLPPDLGTFDRIYCANAMPYLTDISGTLWQWRNLLKPGGALAFNCWRSPSYATGQLLREVAGRHGIRVAEVGALTGTPERCRTLLEAAGYEDVEIVIDPTHHYVRPEHLANYVDTALDNPLYGIQLDDVPKLALLREEYREALRSREFQESLTAECGAYFVSAKNVAAP